MPHSTSYIHHSSFCISYDHLDSHLTSGLDGGEALIVSGPENLHEGMRVKQAVVGSQKLTTGNWSLITNPAHCSLR